MLCCVYTDQWIADTGFIGDDDQDQEIEALNHELQNIIAPEVQAIIEKLSVNKKLIQVIKASVQQQLTISIEAETLDKTT